ncbi:MAG: TonB-dependent receptor [Pseudomonadota bacterium]
MPVLADTSTAPAVSVRQVFLPAAFNRFVPRTALDMAQQVPGFVLPNANADRGFGQADVNVLVNLRRISGKSNGPLEALGRIPADKVVRLEILDGASLDIAGLSGQVLNIVTDTAGGITGRYRYSPTVRTDDVPFRWGDGEISLSGGGVRSEWTLSFTNEQRRFGDSGPEFVFDGLGALTDTRFERRNENYDTPVLSGSYARTARNGNVLNLTGAVGGYLYRETEVSERNATNEPLTRSLRLTEDEFNFELGGDYEFAVLGGRLKLIGLYRFESSPTTDTVEFTFQDGMPPEGTQFSRSADEAEAVVRSEYTLGAFGGTWQWSLEGAHNSLEIDAALSQFDQNGALQPLPLPGASSRVEEDRAETTLSYQRGLTPKLQLQVSAGAEYSQLRQSGEFGLTRDFVRPKGFVSLNWKPSTSLALSARIERVVGQLNFFDFIASVNVNQGRVNVTSANLVPPQSWLGELELQQSLGGFGTVTLTGFVEDISDIVDRIPIDGGGQAPGNIDSALRYGTSLVMTLMSDPVGWKGARLDLSAEYTTSQVDDPVTNASRRISGERLVSFDATLRQDVPQTQWAGGLTLSYNEDTPLVRVDEISVSQPGFDFLEAFFEYKDFYGVTLRLRAANITSRANNFFRTRFADRANDVIEFREERFRQFGTIFRFDIEGSF